MIGLVGSPAQVIALQLLLAQPHQVVALRGRQLHREHAAGRGRQAGQRRAGLADRRGAERALALLRLDPAAQRTQLRRGRHLAAGQHLAVVEQHGPGGLQRLQQRARVAEQRQPPVAFGGGGLDQPLLQAPHLDRDLGTGVVLDGGDARGNGLAEQFAGGAHRTGQVARLVVMAGDQAPQPAFAHQRDHQRGRDAHVHQVLQVQRRHAAQVAQRHVQFALRAGCLAAEQVRHQRGRLVVHVDQHAHAVAQVQVAGALRDVGGRVAMAEQRLQPRVARLGNDLAVAVGVETVDHHPVVADDVAQVLHHAVGQRADGRSLADALHQRAQLAEQRRAVDLHAGHARRRRVHRLQLQHQHVVGDAVHRAVEQRRADGAAQRLGFAQVALGAQGLQLGTGITLQLMQVAQQQPVERTAKPTARTAAGLHDAQLRLLQHQQQTVRLDRPGELDQLAIAVRHIGLAKGWADRHGRVQA